MDYYLCKTPSGPQLAATQGDAKPLDKAFKPYSIDTSKKPLMEFINQLLAGTHELQEGPPLQPAEGVVYGTVKITDEVIAPKLPSPPKIPGACPSCHRTPVAAKVMGKIAEETNVQDWIDTIGEDTRFILDNLEETIRTRRAELDAAKAALNPPKRKRA